MGICQLQGKKVKFCFQTWIGSVNRLNKNSQTYQAHGLISVGHTLLWKKYFFFFFLLNYSGFIYFTLKNEIFPLLLCFILRFFFSFSSWCYFCIFYVQKSCIEFSASILLLQHSGFSCLLTYIRVCVELLLEQQLTKLCVHSLKHLPAGIQKYKLKQK